ncbi:MAG: hypothetical protein C0498_02865 [Anaerolinea sp.]|nr:hypothetical protein [Anaerolinea sp.]
MSVLAGLAAGAAACAAPAPAQPGVTFGPAPSSTAAPAAAFTVEIHRSPTCACCHEWVAYLRAEGTTVTEVEEADVSAYKRSLGIPQELWSCHTSVVDGYVVEGHVPLEAIERLLAERPDIDGIALAGMPPGSPGMPGPKEAPLEVQSFRNGVITPFGTY